MDKQEKASGKIAWLIMMIGAGSIFVFALYLCAASVASGYVSGLGFFGPAALIAFVVCRYAYRQYQEVKSHE